MPVEEVPEQPAPPAERPDPELWRAVRRLPGKQRAAVTLRFAADLDYASIGTVIECSEDAARQNVRAGLASVRREWVR
jgi:DNA-directed RNA polymerase specialized sigma24 family protein